MTLKQEVTELWNVSCELFARRMNFEFTCYKVKELLHCVTPEFTYWPCESSWWLLHTLWSQPLIRITKFSKFMLGAGGGGGGGANGGKSGHFWHLSCTQSTLCNYGKTPLVKVGGEVNWKYIGLYLDWWQAVTKLSLVRLHSNSNGT